MKACIFQQQKQSKILQHINDQPSFGISFCNCSQLHQMNAMQSEISKHINTQQWWEIVKDLSKRTVILKDQSSNYLPCQSLSFSFLLYFLTITAHHNFTNCKMNNFTMNSHNFQCTVYHIIHSQSNFCTNYASSEKALYLLTSISKQQVICEIMIFQTFLVAS